MLSNIGTSQHSKQANRPVAQDKGSTAPSCLIQMQAALRPTCSRRSYAEALASLVSSRPMVPPACAAAASSTAALLLL